MPLFLCDKCGAIENTALGTYWCRTYGDTWADKSLNGLALCSQCTPAEYADGKATEWGGKWHGKFERKFPNASEVKTIGLSNFVPSERLTKLMNDEG